MTSFDLRPSLAGDTAQIERLYRETFPAEDLVPLVRDLLSLGAQCLSLVGMAGDAIVGHVAFTRCEVEGCPSPGVALLGPLAVAPAEQGQGLGGALIHAGVDRLLSEGVVRVLVLGDPRYYGRFGFATEAGVVPPYPLPDEWRSAWQSLTLATSACEGQLVAPQPWQRPELWAP